MRMKTMASPQINDAAEAEPAPQLLIKATVARGRSVLVASGESKVIGHGKDGIRGHRPGAVRRWPGDEITMPADEVKRLQASGYLVDPDKIVPPMPDAEREIWERKRGR